MEWLNLNLIKTLWNQLERDLRALTPLPSSLKDLSQRLLELWTNIRLDCLKNLVESMPNRMKVAINVKDGLINY